MASFISKSACQGHRPLHLASTRFYQRPAIIARLLRERSVARFIVAPFGYGKTSLALEYAETLFGFRHVFWFTCESPCFLRDLDAGSLVAGMLEFDSQPQLAVFDDVPPMDAERAAQFSLVIDSLIDIGCEVLVCLLPSVDAYAQLQRDRIRVGANDLLLTDSECEMLHVSAALPVPVPQGGRLAVSRVAAIGWAPSAKAPSDFLRGVAKEELPAEVVLAVLAMLVLASGTFADLEQAGPVKRESLFLIGADYPHLGVDLINERFDTLEFDPADIAFAYRRRLDDVCAHSRFDARDDLALCWANLLVGTGNLERACNAVQSFCMQRSRADWLLDHVSGLIDAGCILPTLDVLASLGSSAATAEVLLAKARCFALLSDREALVACASRVAFDTYSDNALRVQALIMVQRNASDASRTKAALAIDNLLANAGEFAEEPSLADAAHAGGQAQAAILAFDQAKMQRAKEPNVYRPSDAFWVPLAAVHKALSLGPLQAMGVWKRALERNADAAALIMSLPWLLDAAMAQPSFAMDAASVAAVDPLASFIVQRFEATDAAPCGIFEAMAGLAFERARAGGLIKGRVLPAQAMLWLHDAEMALLRQRRAFDVRKREAQLQRADKLATHPDSYLGAAQAGDAALRVASAPLLDVKLFGGMEVSLGGVRIDLSQVKRDKVKTLLAILVVARGRDVSRDAIVASLWPESPADTARRNFYTVWSQLRDLLKLPDGTCPYLIRQHGGCSVDTHLVRSDVKRFDAVCRELQFGTALQGSAVEIYRQIDEEFSNDLLPAEHDNPIILAARDECRVQLVDALVAGAANLTHAGSLNQAIWLARSAVRNDDVREDAYVALMNAQIALGQRTAALMTFFKYKSVLSEQLGLDPSDEVVALYESLIDPVEVSRARRA